MDILAFADGVIIGTEAIRHTRRYVQIITLGIFAWALIDKRQLAQYLAALSGLLVLVILLSTWF